MTSFQAPVPGPVVYQRRAQDQRRGVLGPVLALVALGVCGLLVFGILVGEAGVPGVVVGTFCALFPVGPVVAAFLWMDRWEPEPPRMLLLAFLWGACFAALAALVVNSTVEALAGVFFGPGAQTLSPVLVAPVVEESLKGAFLLGLFWFRRREFDGILDGVVYAGLVAAGFAFSENVLYLGRAFAEGAAAGQSGGVLTVLIMRGVFSPFAHPLFTSMTGIGLGIAANARGPGRRFVAPVVGYLLAVFLHGLWNGSASYADGAALVPVYLLIMFPLFGFTVLLVLYQRRREQRIIAAELPGFAHAGWIALSEVGLLQSLAGRRGWRRAVQARSGTVAAKAVHDYQRAITELAFLRHRMARASVGPEARLWHDELLAEAVTARARAVGMPEALTAAWARRPPPPGWAPPRSQWRPGDPPPPPPPAPPPPSAPPPSARYAVPGAPAAPGSYAVPGVSPEPGAQPQPGAPAGPGASPEPGADRPRPPAAPPEPGPAPPEPGPSPGRGPYARPPTPSEVPTPPTPMPWLPSQGGQPPVPPPRQRPPS